MKTNKLFKDYRDRRRYIIMLRDVISDVWRKGFSQFYSLLYTFVYCLKFLE